MKNVLIVLTVLFTFNTAMANDDLAASMKVIGEQFGLLGQSIQQKKIGEDEFAAVEKMHREIAKSSLIQPDNAVTTEDKLTYATWMAELMEASFRLEDAMKADAEKNPVDTADSFAILLEMNEMRKEGHSKFKTN